MASATSPALGAPAEDEVEPPDEAFNDPDEGQAGDVPGWLALLQADTPESEIHQRAMLRKGGQPVMRNGEPVTLDYVTARFVMDRLDAAVGPPNWADMYESLSNGAVRCGLSIRIPGEDGLWVTKWDVGVPSSIEPDKGAHSDALKRAAVKWGIARDLYDDRDADPVPEVDAQLGQQQQAQVSPIKQQVQGNGAQQGQQMSMDGAPEWVCPIHDDMKIVPAGISKRTGKAYTAFYACPVGGCDEKGPSIKA